jgi:tRNA isopentenyl-2-thiomethyl-A-37 hydroxylase MiaE
MFLRRWGYTPKLEVDERRHRTPLQNEYLMDWITCEVGRSEYAIERLQRERAELQAQIDELDRMIQWNQEHLVEVRSVMDRLGLAAPASPVAEPEDAGAEFIAKIAESRAEIEQLDAESSAHIEKLGRNGKARFLGL